VPPQSCGATACCAGAIDGLRHHGHIAPSFHPPQEAAMMTTDLALLSARTRLSLLPRV
jgi:hypothetical protein